MQPLRFIDKALNGITMYRLVLYGLAVQAGAGILLSFLHVLPFAGIIMLVSLGLSLTASYVANAALSRSWKITSNTESTLITAFILFMILPPATTVAYGLAIILASIFAIASKYLLVARGRHIFNPAAFGLAVVAITGLSYSRWWIGSAALLPFVVIVGLLVVRKIRRFTLVSTFIATALVVMLIIGLSQGRDASSIFIGAFTSWPLIFAGTIMLTEPGTMPVRQKQRLIYAVIVGAIFSSQLHFGPISSTPEVALLIGNVFALAVSPASRMRLKLIAKHKMAENVYDFEFEADKRVPFQAGQYAELTLSVDKPDDRGNRRTFTIASAPSEQRVHFGIKFYTPSSRFKQTFAKLQPGDVVQANHVMGDFVLPDDATKKLALIAGGIGITPFRSQLMELLNRNQEQTKKRDIVLFYAAASTEELSYQNVLHRATAELGLRIVPIVKNSSDNQLNTDLIKRELPDFAERSFYVSGPSRMVDSTLNSLHQLGVKRTAIKTDHFSGY